MPAVAQADLSRQAGLSSRRVGNIVAGLRMALREPA